MTHAQRDAIADIARQVRVIFRKQVSDGNYGTEAAEISLEDTLPAEADDTEVDILAEALFMEARRYVQAELGRSPSRRVRETVIPKVVIGPPDELEDLPL